MRDMFFDEKDESEWEKKSEFATFYQDVKERYRKSGRYIAKMKFITGEDQVDAFTEKYMEMQAEYWIALLYLAYRKNAMDQDELVKIMKYDAHDAEQFFEKFEELARTSSVQKKVQNLSVNQENGMWRLDFSVLKTEFINFNIGMIIEKKEDVEAQVDEWKEKLEMERAKIREHERRIEEIKRNIQEVECNVEAIKKAKKDVETEYVKAYMRERHKQERANQERPFAQETEFVSDFPWSWLLPIEDAKMKR